MVMNIDKLKTMSNYGIEHGSMLLADDFETDIKVEIVIKNMYK